MRATAALAMSTPGDPHEHEADRVAGGEDASSLAGRADMPQARAPRSLLDGLGAGRAIDRDVRSAMEARFRHDFSGVRIHDSGGADHAARAIDASAFAVANHIVFRDGMYAPSSPRGQHLIAHELAHTVQQRKLGARVQRHRFNPDNDAMSQPLGPTGDPTSGVDFDETINIAAPLLAGQRARGRDADQKYHIHPHVTSKLPITMYALPRSLLQVWSGWSSQPAAGAPGVAAPTIAPGSIVVGPDHIPQVVVSADAANVIVESSRTIHYAVGAGSCVLVGTSDGYYLFDAGVNAHVKGPIANAIADRVAGVTKRVRVKLYTHTHWDHIALDERLSQRIQIDYSIANTRQLTREEYTKMRDARIAADLVRRAKERARLAADPSEREKLAEKMRRDMEVETLNPADFEREWLKEVDRLMAERFPETKELAALPVKGSNGLEFEVFDTRRLHGDDAPSVDLADLLPSDAELRMIVDPEHHLDPHEPLPDTKVVDSASTTYILTIKNRRLLVLPDLRRNDLVALRKQLTEVLGTKVEFQEWILGHHAQVGFLDDAHIVSGQTLRKMVELLHDFRAADKPGVAGRDVVIASVDPTLVDPAMIRVMRLVGYETYLAKDMQDVHTYEVMSRGKVLRGVRGKLAVGAAGEPTLRRSMAGRASLEQQRQAIQAQIDRTRGKGSKPTKDRLRGERDALKATIDHITALEDKLIEASVAKPFDAQAAADAELALSKALDAAHVGKVVTSSARITDTALVLLREPLGEAPDPNSPEGIQRARDLALREQKSKVDLLRERMHEVPAEQRSEAYAEHYAELIEYQHQLEVAKTWHDPGITHEFIEAEIERIQGERVAFEKAFTTGHGEAVRLPDGQLVESKVIKFTPENAPSDYKPSPLAQKMLKGLDVVGKGMGGIMVISTITGTKDLIERYESGQANLAEVAFGATHQLTSAVVGLRMLRGAKVNSGVFVVISALEVGEAVFGTYETSHQRDRAINASVRNLAVNTACMYIGEALIATGHPIAIAAGAIIMFAGPWLINKLFEDEPPEDLFPGQVETVDKKLEELLLEYESVIGDIQLAEQKAKGQLGNVDLFPEGAIFRHRMRAMYLEQQILPAFEEAYTRVRDGRAGLRELDVMRKRFLEMRVAASTDTTDEETRENIKHMVPEMADPSFVPYGYELPEERDEHGQLIPIREITLRRFEAMEKGLSLDGYTAEQVNKMEQWSSIVKYAAQLYIMLAKEGDDPDWGDVAKRQHDLEARVASARYRIDPTSQYDKTTEAARFQPLLKPGTAAYAAYMKKLESAESQLRTLELMILRTHWINLKMKGVDVSVDAIANQGRSHFPTTLAFTIGLVEDALQLYKKTIVQLDGPPPAVGGVEALYRDASARRVYIAQLSSDKTFAKMLERCQINEIAATSLIDDLARQIRALPSAETATATSELNKLRDRFHALRNNRRERRGILYLHEVQALETGEKDRALAYYKKQMNLPEDRLTAEQQVALQDWQLGEPAKQVLEQRRSVLDRLAQVPDLRIPIGPTQQVDPKDPSQTPMHVSRSLAGIMRLDGLESDVKMLVGVVQRGVLPNWSWVVPVNEAAATKLGGYGKTLVYNERLIDATEDDLKP